MYFEFRASRYGSGKVRGSPVLDNVALCGTARLVMLKGSGSSLIVKVKYMIVFRLSGL